MGGAGSPEASGLEQQGATAAQLATVADSEPINLLWSVDSWFSYRGYGTCYCTG
jgi:hypothetical protein